MLDIINRSQYFQQKSGYEKYTKPESESNSENDAITNKYEIDFKLLVDEKDVYYKSQNVPKVDYSNMKHKGYILVQENDILNLTEEENILIKLFRSDFSNTDNNTDIRNIIKNAKKKKNLLWYYPFEFKKNQIGNKNNITKLFNITMRKFLEYRKQCSPNNETYVCTKYDNFFIIYKFDGNKLIIIDEINELWIQSYIDINNLSLY